MLSLCKSRKMSRVPSTLKLLHAYVNKIPEPALQPHDEQPWAVAVVQPEDATVYHKSSHEHQNVAPIGLQVLLECI